MKKFKTIKEMRQDPNMLNLTYGQYTKVLIDGKEYIVTSSNGTYDDIIEDYLYKALEKFNKEFDINKLPVPKGYSLEDAMFETCVALREKLLEEYAEAGIEFINVREAMNNNVIYENLEDKDFGISNLTAGDILTIEGYEYIVIEKVQGTQYKVLANELANNGGTMQFGSTNEYKISRIATYLDNDYYNSLSPSIQNAIIETSIQQKVSSTGYDGDKNNPTWTGEAVDAGTHKIFIPSWDEVTKVYGSTPEQLKTYSNGSYTYTWLRDTCRSGLLLVQSRGVLNELDPHNYECVRPAFVIDLSKVKCKEYKPLLGKSDIKFLAPLLIPYTGVPATMKKILTTVPCLNGAVTEFYVLHIESKLDGCPLAIIPLTVATPDFDLLDTNIQYELDIKALLKEYINSEN